MSPIAWELAAWASDLRPSDDDLQLAQRSLMDTVAVAIAAADEPLLAKTGALAEAGRWAVAAHVLDFDDLHMPSTSHVSAVMVPTALACGGTATTYLAGAGVMARLGAMLGWSHYTAGWHATCTAGAPGAAVAASLAAGLDVEATAHAVALAVPAAGGVQRAFGTEAKSLQVGMAVDAGIRAARLAAAGCRGDLGVVEQWLALVGAATTTVALAGPAVPDGLAIKLYPCCYAMQRPISAVREALAGAAAAGRPSRLRITTPVPTVQPLTHHRPTTGLQAKFSLEYAAATAVVDGFPGLDAFTDAAAARPEVQALLPLVDVELVPGGAGLLAGRCDVEVAYDGGARRAASLDLPPGAPARPPTDGELRAKAAACGSRVAAAVDGLTWATAAAVLREALSASRVQMSDVSGL